MQLLHLLRHYRELQVSVTTHVHSLLDQTVNLCKYRRWCSYVSSSQKEFIISVSTGVYWSSFPSSHQKGWFHWWREHWTNTLERNFLRSAFLGLSWGERKDPKCPYISTWKWDLVSSLTVCCSWSFWTRIELGTSVRTQFVHRTTGRQYYT